MSQSAARPSPQQEAKDTGSTPALKLEQPQHILPIVPAPVYTRAHNVLVVGDGNFSFSAGYVKSVHRVQEGRSEGEDNGIGGAQALAATPVAGGCVCATSYDALETVLRKYPESQLHLDYLRSSDCAQRPVKVVHGVDAMAIPPAEQLVPPEAATAIQAAGGWDFIIFNFPLAPYSTGRELERDGIHPALPNRWLLHRFLHSAASRLRPGTGRVVITTKFSYRYQLWRIETLGPCPSRRFIGVAPFQVAQFPGYRVRKIEMSKPDGSDLGFGMADHSAVAEPEADEESSNSKAAVVTRRSDGALSFIFRAPGPEEEEEEDNDDDDDAQTESRTQQARTNELAATKRKVDESLDNEKQPAPQKRCRMHSAAGNGNAVSKIKSGENRHNKIVEDVRALLLSSGVAESGNASDALADRGEGGTRGVGLTAQQDPGQVPFDSTTSLSKKAQKKQAKAKARAAQKASRAASRKKNQSREDALATALSRCLCGAAAGGGGGAVVEPPNCHICYTHCNSVRELARHALGKKHRRRAEVEILWDAFRRQKEREMGEPDDE